MRVLGVNAVFHDPAAALVVDGEVVAAAEEERFSRRKHGKSPVPFSTWEMPEAAARWCLAHAGLDAADLDAVAYSYDPALAPALDGDPTRDGWEGLRTLYAARAERFLRASLPGLPEGVLRHVPHHVAHAASAYLAGPFTDCAVMVLDGRGERTSYLAGVVRDGRLEVLARQELPHSLGLLYEEVTEHLGFRRSSDEYKVMALASYGRPAVRDALAGRVAVDGRGGFVTLPVDWEALAPRVSPGGPLSDRHADLAASVQRVLQDTVGELADGLHAATGATTLALAGGVALNCVANSALRERGSFRDVWVQPAAGDSGTALGAALYVAAGGDAGIRAPVRPMRSAALGRGFTDAEIEAHLRRARVRWERPADLATVVAGVLAADGVVGWFQGRSEFGPRALGQRSLLASPALPQMTTRLNEVKGREQFRPVAPMVRTDRARDVFTGGPLPSPYMLFVHRVRPEWAARIPAVVHVDGTARVQTVDPEELPLMARVLDLFEERTGLPVLVNTSFNTAGRPMVDSPVDALECFGASPIDLLAIGPFVVRRP